MVYQTHLHQTHQSIFRPSVVVVVPSDAPSDAPSERASPQTALASTANQPGVLDTAAFHSNETPCI